MKLSTPKGTRDFSPDEVGRRNYIFDTIRSVFRLYGYRPIETPAMENLSTLTGKYGNEGDRLIFKIQMRGERLKRGLKDIIENKGGFREDKSGEIKEPVSPKEMDNLFYEANALSLTDEALRYDLTVPFARYVVQHQNDITFPFKRYQIQPVWRADRPQKGRYREFWQCDADVIGSDSLLNEVELVLIMDAVFSRLKIPVRIRVNNRKILLGIAEAIGERDRFADLVVAMDKLDKIGEEGVREELTGRGFSTSSIDQLTPFFSASGSDYRETLNTLDGILARSDTGRKGIEELRMVFEATSNIQHPTSNIQLDITLARGLDYYTGAIFEAVTDNFHGSLCGGGRYDDLTGIFGMPGVSGVGISFGADRIYDVMEQNGLFPPESAAGTRVLFVNFGEAGEKYCLPLVQRLRAAGISAELYPDRSKLKKQMQYADVNGIPWVVLAGAEEIASGKLTLKNMASGEQQTLSAGELIKTVA